MSKLTQVQQRAAKYGGRNVKKSPQKNKKYVVEYKGKKIHFGHPSYQDYLDHQDDSRRKNYQARASKIRNKQGQLTYKNKNSANFWAYHVLW